MVAHNRGCAGSGGRGQGRALVPRDLGATHRGYARWGRWNDQARVWKGLSLHGDLVGAEEVCHVVSMGLSRGEGHPGGGEGVQ